MKYYDENRNGYYNPDDGQDSVLPGENANWKAIQAGFAASAAKDSQQDTDVASAANVAEAARRTADQALEAAQAAGGDITDLEAAVRTAQQTADSAGTAAAAAQTAAGNASSAAQAAQQTAATAQTAAGNASSAASSATSAAQTAQQTAAAAQTATLALADRVTVLEATSGTPTSIAGNLEMTAESTMVIPPNRIVFLTGNGGRAYTFGNPDNPSGSPIADGVYQLPPTTTLSGMTAFPSTTSPISLSVVAIGVTAPSSDDDDDSRIGITVSGGDGTVTGRVMFAVQSNELSDSVTIPQGTRLHLQTYFIRTAYPPSQS